MEAGERVASVAKSAGVLRKSLYEWRDAYKAFGAAGLNRKRGPNRVRASGGPTRDRPTRLRTNSRRPGAASPLWNGWSGASRAISFFFREALRSWDEQRRANGALISSRSSKK